MPKSNHKYRVSVYLGKEMYEQIDCIADALQIPLSTAVKIILSTGFEVSKTFNKQADIVSVLHDEDIEEGVKV